MKYIDDYKIPGAAAYISNRIKDKAGKLPGRISIMEVCGSHTMAIAKFGIRELLPDNIDLISGPGCPVCVTDSGYIDAAIELSGKGAVIATFGDMINVPGSVSTLAKSRSGGGRVEICYSPMNALELAAKNKDSEIVFLSIGFETTIAPIICMLDSAIRQAIGNISILTAFKLVPPALKALASDDELRIDGFICPAHVSAIIGANAYNDFVNEYEIPCVIASFEPLDILLGIEGIVDQILAGHHKVENQYSRVVTDSGNTKALAMMHRYLEPCDAIWRGIGRIPGSGLALKKEFSSRDSAVKFGLELKPGSINNACRCGDVLKGKIKPPDCMLFAKACNPSNPIGPCMVSLEGSCSAWFKYHRT